MTIAALLKELRQDQALIPTRGAGALPEGAERRVRVVFISKRVYQLLPALRDPNNPDNLVVNAVALARQSLLPDVPRAVAAFDAIWAQVSTDPDQLELPPLDAEIVRRNKRVRAIIGSPQGMRRHLVQLIVWGLGGEDAGLLDPANSARLQRLVHRRLRSVERMLYDIGGVGGERWKGRMPPIIANPAGPWVDGWNRAFEYPRVPSGEFLPLCQPGQNRLCQAPGLAGWRARSHDKLARDIQVNTVSTDDWVKVGDYQFWLRDNADPVAAIFRLFEPTTDFKTRCLLYCDQVLHLLHLEALVFSRWKNAEATPFLDPPPGFQRPYPDEPLGWIRISNGNRRNVVFLGNRGQPAEYFSRVPLHRAQLQIGDHIVIYAHPAYDHATVDGYWRLENAFVVRLGDRFLVQGHGLDPVSPENPGGTEQTIGCTRRENPKLNERSMKRSMLRLFNCALDRLRDILQAHLNNPDPAVTELEIGNPRSRLVRRVDPGASQFVGAAQKADWWLRWQYWARDTLDLGDYDEHERDVADNPQLRQLALQRHRIEYDTVNLHGYFPLWEPQRRRDGSPVTNPQGRIARVQPVLATSDMVAAWTWFFPLGPRLQNHTIVTRPNEV